MTVRTRYAPSPTGEQHIGGLRTALYNYLFARAHGGHFVLRIEDTDRTRLQPGAAERIAATLAWIGMSADESPASGGPHAPYVQSERLPLYREQAARLVASGRAYWAFDSDAELAELRQRGRGYDQRGRTRSDAENAARQQSGVAGVVRLMTPEEGESRWDDLVMGTIVHNHRDVPRDPVLLKSDGYPTYHLANVVDDHMMAITHVLRAQEWLSSTPLHLLLYRALDWEPPRYAHLPLIVGGDGKKLSKRHGATSVDALRQSGILPAALCNYIALLGWSYDSSREHFTLAELEQLFTIETVQKAGALFDMHKLRWHNGYYLRQLDNTMLLSAVTEALQQHETAASPSLPSTAADADASTSNGQQAASTAPNRPAAIVAALATLDAAARDTVAEALRPRVDTAGAAAAWLGYLTAIETPQRQALVGKKLSTEQATALLAYLQTLGNDTLGDVAKIEQVIDHYCQEHGLPFGHTLGLLRVALSGQQSSLPTRVLLVSLPAATIRERIRRARAAI